MSLEDASIEYWLLADQAGIGNREEIITPEILLFRALQLVGVAKNLVLAQSVDEITDALPQEPFTMLFEHPAVPEWDDKEYLRTIGYNKNILGRVRKAEHNLARSIYKKGIGDATYKLNDKIMNMDEYLSRWGSTFGKLLGITVLKPKSFADYVIDLRTATDDKKSRAKTLMSTVKTSPALADVIIRKVQQLN